MGQTGGVKKLLAKLTLSAFAVAAMLGLAEFVAHQLYRHPSPGARLTASRAFHLTCVRGNMSFDREMTDHDPVLSYRFKSNAVHRFSAPEYDFEIRTNSRGFRDDEESLIDPDIVVVGDSYAFGWGVEETDSFPAVLERALGRKVLNEGLPSYSASRSLALHKELGIKPKVLVIQYCDNDANENRSFFNTGGRIPCATRQGYEEFCDVFEGPQYRYYPGRYLREYIPLWRSYERAGHTNGVPPFVAEQKRDVDTEASWLANALRAAQLDNHGTLLVVTELSTYGRNLPGFPDAVLKIVQYHNAKLFGFAYAEAVDMSEILQPGDHYTLDDHCNAQGYRKAGEAIAEAIRPYLELLDP